MSRTNNATYDFMLSYGQVQMARDIVFNPKAFGYPSRTAMFRKHKISYYHQNRIFTKNWKMTLMAYLKFLNLIDGVKINDTVRAGRLSSQLQDSKAERANMNRRRSIEKIPVFNVGDNVRVKYDGRNTNVYEYYEYMKVAGIYKRYYLLENGKVRETVLYADLIDGTAKMEAR